jgi:hypothetical protein
VIYNSCWHSLLKHTPHNITQQTALWCKLALDISCCTATPYNTTNSNHCDVLYLSTFLAALPQLATAHKRTHSYVKQPLTFLVALPHATILQKDRTVL